MSSFSPPSVTGQPGGGPPAPPTPRPAPGPRQRFGGVALGVVLGAIVGGLVGAGVYVVMDDDGGAAPAPTTTPTLTTATPATTGSAAGTTNAIEDIVARTRPSIVSIHDEITQTDIFGQPVEGQAAGTGFVLGADGFVVTNDHVVSGASNITVDFADRTGVAAEIVATDPANDLAVLHVDRTDLVLLPLGDSDGLVVGDQVVAVGNALDLSGEPTVTTGIVSATGRYLTEPNGVSLTNLIQTDTAINPGNSGGPLLDMEGRAVGINTAVAGEAQNIGFAIAITPALDVIHQLAVGTVPAHALLGVSARPFLGADGTPGAEVVEVTAGSAADDAGIRPGDVITGIDDTAIDGPDALGAAIAAHRPGDTVSVTYVRGGQETTVDATLGTRPDTGG